MKAVLTDCEHSRMMHQVSMGRSTYYDFLDTFKESLCLEPRDRTYGFVSLASDCQKSQIVPGYSKLLVAIYVDILTLHQNQENDPERSCGSANTSYTYSTDHQ